MTDPEHTERCTVCATTNGPFEQHHIALRANSRATVPLCRDCHPGQTERQRRAGLITKHRHQGGDGLSLLHAVTEGMAAIFDAIFADHPDSGVAELAAANEQARRVALRLLAVASPDHPGALGPRPISNDRRRKHLPARGASAASDAELVEALAGGLFPALATAIAGTLPGDVSLLPGLTVDELPGLITPAGAHNLAVNLPVVESHPRIGELTEVAERDRHTLLAAVSGLAQAAASHGLGEPINSGQVTESIRSFLRLAEDWIALLSALASSPRRGDAEAALGRFLERRTIDTNGWLVT